jgi:hypothetical protein
MRRWYRAVRFVLFAVSGGMTAALTALVLVNVCLNTGLEPLINRQPERLRVTWALALMLEPGHVYVWGLNIRSQTLVDQWEITASHVTGDIDLDALWYQRFIASDVSGEGVTFRYRVRADNPPPADVPTALADAQPPIGGLKNPPDPAPEDLYPPPTHPWLVSLTDVDLHTTDVWMSEYRFDGDSVLTGSFLIEGAFVDADLSLQVGETRARRGREVVAEQILGHIDLLIDGMDRLLDRGDDTFRSVSATLALSANAHDLDFVSFYLGRFPWLSLDGSGEVALSLAFEGGALQPGSKVTADFPDLTVGFMSYDITGRGALVAAVVDHDGVPESRIGVDFREFVISRRDRIGALVTGEGFHLDATSPDVGLNMPFTHIAARLEFPESRIVDIEPYNEFLPQDIGFSILGGRGTLRGELAVSTEDNIARGDLWITGQSVQAKYEPFTLGGGLDIHAHLAEGRLDKGYYDMSGTMIDLHQMSIVDSGAPEHASRGWSASLEMPHGIAQVGAADYLDATLAMRCSDSKPFVALFVQKGQLPRWAGGLLEVDDVSGSLRLRLGLYRMRIDPAEVLGGRYQLLMRLSKTPKATVGDLYARYGKLSLGLGLHGGPAHVQVFGARAWYDRQPPLE